jgi:hypothetical protein
MSSVRPIDEQGGGYLVAIVTAAEDRLIEWLDSTFQAFAPDDDPIIMLIDCDADSEQPPNFIDADAGLVRIYQPGEEGKVVLLVVSLGNGNTELRFLWDSVQTQAYVMTMLAAINARRWDVQVLSTLSQYDVRYLNPNTMKSSRSIEDANDRDEDENCETYRWRKRLESAVKELKDKDIKITGTSLSTQLGHDRSYASTRTKQLLRITLRQFANRYR